MASSPVTYATFFTIYIQKGPSLSSIIRLIHDFSSQRGLVSRSAMVFIVLTMLFVLALPTLVSAMTSYNAVTQAMVLKVDGTYEPLLQFQPLAYMIHDGWRINLTGDYPVPYTNYSNTSISADPLIYGDSYSIFPICADPGQVGNDSQYLSYNYFNGLDCRMQNDVSQCGFISILVPFWPPEPDYKFTDARTYGFYGLRNTTTIWKNLTLPPPALNISAFYLQNLANTIGETNSTLFGNSWVIPGTAQQPFKNKSQMSWTSSNLTYNIQYLEENGACQPILNVSTLVWPVASLCSPMTSHVKPAP